jgi:nitroreductase
MYTFKYSLVKIIFEDDSMSVMTMNEFTNTKVLLEAIQQRRSIRNYSDKTIPPEITEKINEYLSTPELMIGPLFGSHFKIVVLQKQMGDAPGTYGYIKNAIAVLAGVANYEKLTLFELAYVFHGLVLYLTSKGLQTCWVGASFNHKDIIEAGEVSEDEIVPAIAFFGYQKENKGGERQKSLREKLMVNYLKPHNRHPIEEFGFLHDFSTPLTEETAGELFTGALNVAKLAPSAQNLQSWRVIVSDNNTIHFYVEKKLMHMVGVGFRKYSCPPEYVENGTFARQFAIHMEDIGIRGKFIINEIKIPLPGNNWEYMVSWKKS